jgi:polyisoprenyl-phosphate glycosyltransferase
LNPVQKISVIVPCFNEEEVLPQLFQRLTAAATDWGADYEVICVDDGSSDGTWRVLRTQHEADARWRGLSFTRNFGHEMAICAGLRYAGGAAAVIMDADLQDPPEDIARLLAKWREGFEVVLAVREKRQDPFVKRALAWLFYRLMARVSPLALPTDTGEFCLLDRKVVRVINSLPEHNRYLRGLRSWCGYRQASVSFQRRGRTAGSPHYNFRRSLKLALDGLFSFSPAPLRAATCLGFLVSGFALLAAVLAFFWRGLAGTSLELGAGFSPAVISVILLGGVQLICLGALGEYILRIHDEVKGRPLWIIGDSAGLPLRVEPPARPFGSSEGGERTNS